MLTVLYTWFLLSKSPFLSEKFIIKTTDYYIIISSDHCSLLAATEKKAPLPWNALIPGVPIFQHPTKVFQNFTGLNRPE